MVRSLPRRDAAAALATDPARGLVFAALDGRPLVARAWAAVRPDSERPVLQRGEDLADDAELERQFDAWVAAQPPVDEQTRQRVDDVLEKALGIQRKRDVA